MPRKASHAERHPACCLMALATLLPIAAPVRGDALADRLGALWDGTIVVARVPLASDCAGFYTDAQLVGADVRSGGDRRFAAGEVARVERIAVKRERLDVFLDLLEPVLWQRQEGPFTLYEERSCKVQLRVPLPRAALADRSGAAAAAELERLLERHPGPEAAIAAAAWNGRRREPYPADYERTLAAHAAWRVAQANAAIQTRLDEALAEGVRIADRVREDPEYLAGFAAGVVAARDRYWSGDCASLTGVSLASFMERPPSGHGDDWRRGHEDGQRLVWSLELARRLRPCIVPPGAED